MAQVLGVKISDISPNEALIRIIFWAKGKGQHYVVTPNPELVLLATHDLRYRVALNSADLALADGFGLVVAAWLNGFKLNRVTGSDTTAKLLPLLARSGLKTMLICWEAGISRADELGSGIRKLFPGLDFSVIDMPRSSEIPANILKKINEVAPDVLFITLGSPWQEFILYNQLPQMPSVKVGLGVGGSFEFLLGRQKRAPKLLRVLGLEWFWRLMTQPKRLGRIWNAVVAFMFYVLLDRVGIRKIKNENEK